MTSSCNLVDGALRILSPRTCNNMAMFRYLKREHPGCPAKVPSLSEEEVHRVNKDLKHSIEQDETSKKGHGKYNDYTAKERVQIGKYAAENGPARAVQHFSRILDRKLLETTARRLKAEVLISASDENHDRREQGGRCSFTGEQFV